MALLKINTPPLIESNCGSVYVCVHVCVSRWAQCVCPERSALSSLAPLVPLKSTTERNEHSPNIWLSTFPFSSPSFFLSFFLFFFLSQGSKFTFLWLPWGDRQTLQNCQICPNLHLKRVFVSSLKTRSGSASREIKTKCVQV